MNTAINKTSLLLGPEFRILLNSSHISYGEIHSVLKAKGIFVGNSDKTITVPLLTASLLTPSEFSDLVESSVTRESRPKMKSSNLDLVSSSKDWITPLKDKLFDKGFDPLLNVEFVDFIDSPQIVLESKDQIKIPYKINRRDISQDLIDRELIFEGEILIVKNGTDLKLEFSSKHSSPQTDIINNKIISRISKILKEEGTVSSDKAKVITFGSLTNEKRILFFNQLTAGVARKLKTASINDMEISRDDDCPDLPDDPEVSWMNQTVKKLKIDGDRLNDIFLISNKKYYQYYYVLRIDMTYPFNISSVTGSCQVSFSFSKTTKANLCKADYELTFEFPKITFDTKIKKDSKKTVTVELEKVVRKLIEEKYKKIVEAH